eukprot:3852178-Prymnesium_polylepis.1
MCTPRPPGPPPRVCCHGLVPHELRHRRRAFPREFFRACVAARRTRSPRRSPQPAMAPKSAHIRTALEQLARHSDRMRSARKAAAAARPKAAAAASYAKAKAVPCRLPSTSDAPLVARKAYWSYWKDLLELEWEQEQEHMHERLTQWPRSRLIKEGICLTDLRAASRGAFFGQPLVRLHLPASSRHADRCTGDAGSSRERRARHTFQSGDEVLLSRREPLETGSERAE